MREFREVGYADVVEGVYAIAGLDGAVYVGESTDCWDRDTLKMAMRLGLDCGIVRELSNSTTKERRFQEALVAKLFRDRGLRVVSNHVNAPRSARCHPERMWYRNGKCVECHRVQRRRKR